MEEFDDFNLLERKKVFKAKVKVKVYERLSSKIYEELKCHNNTKNK